MARLVFKSGNSREFLAFKEFKAGATAITVMPYMLAPGRHSTGDIPRMALQAAEQHDGVLLKVSAPLGADSRLAEVVLQRVEEAGESRE